MASNTFAQFMVIGRTYPHIPKTNMANSASVRNVSDSALKKTQH
jgi:hypothetical protein